MSLMRAFALVIWAGGRDSKSASVGSASFDCAVY